LRDMSAFVRVITLCLSD